jgi:hypothetical protein
VTGRLDKADKLYQELDHFNNGLVWLLGLYY